MRPILLICIFSLVTACDLLTLPTSEKSLLSFSTPIITETITPTATSTALPLLTVNGVWRCRKAPNIESDTIVFLHDGEIVTLVETSAKWTKVKAGNVSCYVNQGAFK